jgi:hypothetical protein
MIEAIAFILMGIGIGIFLGVWFQNTRQYELGYEQAIDDMDKHNSDDFAVAHSKGYAEGLADGSCKCPSKGNELITAPAFDYYDPRKSVSGKVNTPRLGY